MGRLKKRAKGVAVTQKGTRGFGAGVSISFDKTLMVSASARDCLEFASSALREWYELAHRTGQRFDAGMLPRDGNGWVAFDTGLLAGGWRASVAGDDVSASARVQLVPQDRGRRLRLAVLAKQGIRLSGLSGKALDVYTKAVSTYMADALTAT
jgi:hypothetical protein